MIEAFSLPPSLSLSASGGSNTLTRSQASASQQKDGAHPPSGNSLPDSNSAATASGVATESLSMEEQLRKRNAYLQGRVDVLQEQNRQLGQCIHELKSFTDMVSLLTLFGL